MATEDGFDEPPEVSAADTIDAIVRASKRPKDFPLRREFLQRRVDEVVIPGPLSELVKAGDHRALLLFLLLLTKASAQPWDAALPAATWARALDIALPESKSARSTVSKVWMRLENRGLVARTRRERLADVRLLREDGLGEDYTSPGEVGEPYCKVPLALWLLGPDEAHRWYQALSLPELTVLLIGLSLGDAFRLPYESAPDWYGVSADTINRGVAGLAGRGLLDVNKRFKKAPLSAVGYTAEHLYTLQEPFGPIGYRSGSRGSARNAKATAGGPSGGVAKRPAKRAKKAARTASKQVAKKRAQARSKDDPDNM